MTDVRNDPEIIFTRIAETAAQKATNRDSRFIVGAANLMTARNLIYNRREPLLKPWKRLLMQA